MKKLSQIVAFSAIAGISWLLVQNPYVDVYVKSITGQSVVAVKQSDTLMQDIESKAKDYEIAPQDARIDSIWKTVPGLNGLKVNVRESYKAMREKGVFNEKKLVLTQVSPNVHISDLTPAPIYRAHPEKPVVSLLINVAWGNEYLQDMLAILKENDVKATFFLEGRWTKNNPELAKMIKQGEHEIGNHSYSHPDMKTLSQSAAKNEMQKTNEVIEAVTDEKVKWFAPPSGSFRDQTVEDANSLGMGTILWSVDTIDWQKPSPDVLLNRVLSKVHSGAFILMHPTDASASSLEELIQQLKKKGLQIVTVSEAVNEKRTIQ
ncbi:polysaccharide deacetylase family protein [Peribacillus huizhouensis]|uniref:Sporulation protein (Polysaccharide deacetylase family) n=1 Tax=Peribacillus huizhouensis TaxID=1501239 RepID=A0ABR6CIH2_9BACI|nr:polysaccharide deacetylase family protein [Peribacillus huizhouensis]MBA9024820.1 putative sporulation protein (polysaccharide deacetylase family) [Peribacillus huizhouensis]